MRRNIRTQVVMLNDGARAKDTRHKLIAIPTRKRFAVEVRVFILI